MVIAAPTTDPGTEPEPAVPDATRSRTSTVVGAVGRVMVGSGIVLALFAAYQLWGTGIQEARSQSTLRNEFASRVDQARPRLADITVEATSGDEPPVAEPTSENEPPVAEPTSENEPRVAEPTSENEPRVARGVVDPEIQSLLFPDPGEAVARIQIPSLDVDKVVVQGTRVADLRKGPGLYPSAARPGSAGNAAIAGHRTTYGAPFNRIDELVPGDEIVVTTVQGRFEYRVADARNAFDERASDVEEFGDGHALVRPGDNWVLGDFGDHRLTLTACNPEFSARQRIIVVASLVGDPVGIPDEITEAIENDAGSAADTALQADEVLAVETSDASGEAGVGPETSRSVALGASPVDLDQGLGGERGAIPAAIWWLAVATGIWLVASHRSNRRTGWRARLIPFAVALIPVAGALWLCFEAADRALPAY